MEVIERDNNKIVFAITADGVVLNTRNYACFITSPLDPPRQIVYDLTPITNPPE